MIKKFLSLFMFSIFLSSCAGMDIINSYRENLYVDALKRATLSKEDEFFNKPLETENGEKIEVNLFQAKSTENFKIETSGVRMFKKNLLFTFSFIIKKPNIKIESVKVQSVIPGDVLTFIDTTLENKNPNDEVKVLTEINNINNSKRWVGIVLNMPNILWTPEYMDKYLIKFTIKPVGGVEEVIYQPSMIPVSIFNPKK